MFIGLISTGSRNYRRTVVSRFLRNVYEVPFGDAWTKEGYEDLSRWTAARQQNAISMRVSPGLL